MYMRHLEKNYVNDDLINALIANFDKNTMRQCHQHHQHLKIKKQSNKGYDWYKL